jgi:hypothetical protein
MDNSNFPKRVNRLLRLLEQLLSVMEGEPDLKTCIRIDESYYRQKAAELSLMLEQILALETRLSVFNTRLTEAYSDVFHQWRKDVRWLNARLQNDLRHRDRPSD